MLSVTYELKDLPEDAPVRAMEGRGWVHYQLSGGLFLPEGVAALNSATNLILAGGQWFQLWRGEVVTFDSPRQQDQGGLPHARIHRGPLV